MGGAISKRVSGWALRIRAAVVGRSEVSCCSNLDGEEGTLLPLEVNFIEINSSLLVL